MNHLTYAHYMAVLEGELPVALLHHQAQQHLLEVCPVCRDGWDGTVSAAAPATAAAPARRTDEADDADEVSSLLGLSGDPRAVSLAQVEACERLYSQTLEAARLARVDLKRLLARPAAEWPRRVVDARSRMRSRAFAEGLIEEARRRVRTAPQEAAALAALVRPALDRRPGRLELPWARVLVARAEAHRANALRVAGSLPVHRPVAPRRGENPAAPGQARQPPGR